MDRFKSLHKRCGWIVGLATLASGEGLALAQTPTEPAPASAPSPPPPPEAAPAPPPAPAAPPPAAASPAAVPPPAPAEEKPSEPFAFADFGWLNGTNRQHKALLDSPLFTGSFLLDVNYTASAANPIDNTVVGSTALSRNNEITLAFMGFGGDFHYEHARGRMMMQYGLRSTLVPRNDLSTTRGQFDLQTALRYLSEAYGGYHWDAMHGVNLDLGIFMSYVGLFSYDNFENWMYLPSFTSDNTPWFFNGMRLQLFPNENLKIEPWLINGWQTYGKFNEMPGFGFQILWRPQEWFSILSNGYVGWDTQDDPGRLRFHSDNSVEIKYFDDPKSDFLDKMAFSLTGDIGGEQGDGVTPFGGSGKETIVNGVNIGCTANTPCTQQFLSWMLYNRMWFFHDHLGWTVGGGQMHNPGRYLVLAPTGEASSVPQPTTATPPSNGITNGFDVNNGTQFDAYDYETGIQYMPDENQTYGLEFNHRQASVPYFAGHGGVTSPDGYLPPPNGYGVAVPNGWRADLQKGDSRVIADFLLRF
jgi:hypothetical protein